MDAGRDEETIRRYVDAYRMRSFLNEALVQDLRLFRYGAFTRVLTEQTKPNALYFLVEGQVQCTHYHMNGKTAVLALSNPFTAIGDLEILSEQRIWSNVIATRETTMLGVPSSTVERYGADDPRFLRFLIDELRKKMIETNSVQISQVLPVASRLALYILAQPTARTENVVELPDKESLASLLGTTQRHLNRVIKELVAEEAIDDGYPTVSVRDRSTLEAIIET